MSNDSTDNTGIEVSRAGLKVTGLRELLRTWAPGLHANQEVSRILHDRVLAPIREGRAASEDDLNALTNWVGEKEARKFRNLSAVYTRALELAPQVVAKLLSPAAVDIDEIPVTIPSETWRARFEADAELAADEVIQDYYAAVLAGETVAPGSFSFRAFEALRKLDQETLQRAERLFSVAVTAESAKWDGFWMVPGPLSLLGAEYGALHLSHMDFLDLVDAGLIVYPTVSRLLVGKTYAARGGVKFTPRKAEYILEEQPAVYSLTRAGSELSRLTRSAESEPAKQVLAKWLNNPTVSRL